MSVIEIPKIVIYKFTMDELRYAKRLAEGRLNGKKSNTSYFEPDPSDMLWVHYRGVLAEIAAAHRYGGTVSEEFTGARGDKKADLLDADGHWLEVKSEKFQGDDLYLKILPCKIHPPEFDDVHFVLVRLRPAIKHRTAEIYPAIHAWRVRKLGFLKDWGNGPMWSVPVDRILNDNTR